MRQLLAAALMLTATTATTFAADVTLPVETRRPPLLLNIYSDGWAIVWDRRSADLVVGANRLAFEGVSRQMQPSTAMIDAGPGVRLLDIDYDFALLTPDALLRRSVGKTIGVVRTHPTTGEEKVESATLLSADNGIVLKYHDRIETGTPGRLVFYDLPADLRATPGLVASVEAERAGRSDVTLGYVTRGLGWSADYIASWDEKAKTIELTGRATLSNTSGASYPAAEVSLIAGQVNRETPPMPLGRVAAAPMMAEAKAMPEPQELAELYLYRLPGQVTLPDQRTKQVTLLRTPALAVDQQYISEAAVAVYRDPGEPQPQHPQVRLKLTNKGGDGGQPLPAGIVRVFTASVEGVPQLIGEDRIEHIPAGGKISLTPGQAFDITVLRRQTDFKTAGLPENVSESAWAIEVANAKDKEVAVDLVETIPGDWTILAESAAHAKAGADRLIWRLPVPAKGKAQLTYRVRVQQ
ncbi:MAG: DUF4139 domain-containing protein [Rhodospirillales bacterium]|nr:DUF4139 domain-containing protein [Rhodospirillales bacterium]